jgi:hypothetical protein
MEPTLVSKTEEYNGRTQPPQYRSDYHPNHVPSLEIPVHMPYRPLIPQKCSSNDEDEMDGNSRTNDTDGEGVKTTVQ